MDTQIKKVLNGMGFPAATLEKPVRVLSGGENAKVRLCRLMLKEINLLVLDEPTNHLDVLAKDELKRAVKDFKGTVILVSHEPEFYSDIADKVINLENVSNKLI